MLKRLRSAVFGKAPDLRLEEAAQRAHALFDAGDHEAALAAYETLFGASKDPRHLVNGGYCELMLGNVERARRSFRYAQAADPHLAQALVGLGDVAARQQSHAEAVACYGRALAIDAKLAIARNNRSQSLMVLGRMEDAWRDAEVRYRTPAAASLYPHRLDLPLWDGHSACRLLVHWEQGLGDIIQHLRFLPEAARRAGHCSFECPPPLLRVMQGMAGAVTLVPASDRAPDTSGFDCHAPLLSLPYLLRQRQDDLPAPPYLHAPAASPVPGTKPAHGGLRVGLAWRASIFDTRRNMSLACVLDVAARVHPSVRFTSLQKDVTPDEAVLLQACGCLDAGSGFADFGDTASAIRELDAVMTVDTSVAHLSGALGHPTLLMLNEHPAERWMLSGQDTPWYPSARLVRRARDESEADWIARGLARIRAGIAVSGSVARRAG